MFSSGRLKSHWKNPHKIESRHPEIRIPVGGIKIPESNERIPSLKPGVLKNRKIRENFRFSYVLSAGLQGAPLEFTYSHFPILRAGFQWEEFAPSQSHVSANIEIRGQGGNPTRGTG